MTESREDIRPAPQKHTDLHALQAAYIDPIRNINSVNFRKQVQRLIEIASLFIGGGQFVTQSLALILRSPWGIESLIKPLYSQLRHALLHETMAQEVATLQIARRPTGRINQAGVNTVGLPHDGSRFRWDRLYRSSDLRSHKCFGHLKFKFCRVI